MSRAITRALRVACLVAGALGSACALTSKGEPLTPRYFTPASEPSAGPPEPAPKQEAAKAELRLGRVEPAAYLEERIAYRVSDAELAYYDDRRWTEPPEELVRRALERELFEQRGLARVVSGAAPTLDVDVLGFEELRGPPARARVGLRVTLRDERHAQLERTWRVDVPIEPSADPGLALARAMALALSLAARQAADMAVDELRRQEGAPVAAHQ